MIFNFGKMTLSRFVNSTLVSFSFIVVPKHDGVSLFKVNFAISELTLRVRVKDYICRGIEYFSGETPSFNGVDKYVKKFLDKNQAPRLDHTPNMVHHIHHKRLDTNSNQSTRSFKPRNHWNSRYLTSVNRLL